MRRDARGCIMGARNVRGALLTVAALGGCAVRREMFELIANAHVMRQSLQEAYVHPADVSARAPSPPSARNRMCQLRRQWV
jgi:hypothetical protein